ncbi:antibiotic biosynthesis monooxygenase family protein [Nonomuraea glycinis]|uniref:antibiotic biosynthesis monooxygenase family protein n=1 Tax=Nonomuraea glycinis TaxID=2047744 RepID=UPI0033A8C02C
MSEPNEGFRVLLRMRIRAGLENDFEATWLRVGDAVTADPANRGQWLMADQDEPGIYYIVSDWVNEAGFRRFEQSAEHVEHRERLHPYRSDGSMVTSRIVYHLEPAYAREDR